MSFHTNPIDEHPPLLDPYAGDDLTGDEITKLTLVERIDRATFDGPAERWCEYLAWAIVTGVVAVAIWQELSR